MTQLIVAFRILQTASKLERRLRRSNLTRRFLSKEAYFEKEASKDPHLHRSISLFFCIERQPHSPHCIRLSHFKL
jgi:type IV secretory pathway VirD2 relaxase